MAQLLPEESFQALEQEMELGGCSGPSKMRGTKMGGQGGHVPTWLEFAMGESPRRETCTERGLWGSVEETPCLFT